VSWLTSDPPVDLVMFLRLSVRREPSQPKRRWPICTLHFMTLRPLWVMAGVGSPDGCVVRRLLIKLLMLLLQCCDVLVGGEEGHPDKVSNFIRVNLRVKFW